MTERIKEEYVYEYWDCPRCGAKAIRGDFRNCGGCGYSRGDSITFYRKEADELVEDENQVEEFKKGPDWVCSYCSSLISQSDGKCSGCGVTRDDSVQNYFQLQDKKNAGKEKHSSSSTENQAEESAPDSKGSSIKKKLIIFGGIAAAAIFFVIWGFSSKDIGYKVNSVSWERSIPVERYKWASNTDWENDVRGDDVKVISRRREIRSYENRQTGTRSEQYTENEKYQTGTKENCVSSYKSTGSGASKKTTKCTDVPVYSTRQVTKTREVPVYKKFPVYDTRISYRSKLYTAIRTYSKNGSDNRPGWPDPRLKNGLDNKPDRMGKKLEKYDVGIVKLSKDDKGPPASSFQTRSDLFEKKYILNSNVMMKINNFGKIVFEDGEKSSSK